MIKQIYLKFKKYIITFLAIVLFIALCIPFVLAYLYLKQNGKSISIHPTFKIVDAKQEDLSGLSDAISEASQILKGIK